MTGTNWRSSCTALLVILIAALAGCSGESPPGGPSGSESVEASLVLDGVPDAAVAPWTLVGPEGFNETGAGDTTFLSIDPGLYTVTWGPVDDEWVTPPPAAKEIAPTVRHRFEGRYFFPSSSTVELPSMAPVDVSYTLVSHLDTVIIERNAPALPDTYIVAWEDTITFTMGSEAPVVVDDVTISDGEMGRFSNEVQTNVYLTEAFDLAVNEITYLQFMNAMQWALDNGHVSVDVENGIVRDLLDEAGWPAVDLNVDPALSFDPRTGKFGCSYPELPAVGITWVGAMAYCDWLNLHEGLPMSYDHSNGQCNEGDPYRAVGYRMPTEAEWEYACRAGTTTAYNLAENEALDCADGALMSIGWYCGNALSTTHEAGSLTNTNAWGLNDMHGNVWEWCNDWYGDYLQNPLILTNEAGFPILSGGQPVVVGLQALKDPSGITPEDDPTVSEKTMRGGAWANAARYCRSAQREGDVPIYSHATAGLRVAKTTNPTP